MTHRVLKFKGTHKEIGEQVGLLYKKWGHTYSYMPPQTDRYYSQQLKTYEKFYPQYLEFLVGLAKGIKIDKDRIFRFSLTIFLSVANALAKKCTALAIKNKKGVFVGRNYDWLESSEKYSRLLIYDYAGTSSFKIKGISDMGTYKPNIRVDHSNFVLITEDAWNEKGLYVGLNGAPGKKSGLGLTSPHVVQLISEQCDSVNSAIKLLQKIPTTNSHIFTLADKKGNLAVVEKSIEKGVFIRKSVNYVIATNHFNHPKLISENLKIFEKIPFHSTFARYNYTEYNLLNTWKHIDLKSIISLLDKSPVLQNWRGKYGDTITLWSLALNLSNKKYIVKFAPLLSQSITLSN